MHDMAALDILSLVHILFLISVGSLLVLIGATAAIVHHIRASHRSREGAEAPPEPSFSDHLHAAAEYGTPRSPRIVPSQSVQSISAKKAHGSGQSNETGSEGDRGSVGRPGPHLIRRASGGSEAQGLNSVNKIYPASPRLRVVASNRTASSKNL